MRLGIYFNLSEAIQKKKFNQVNKNLSIIEKIGCSLAAGSIGSFIGTPFDLVLVRMQADNRAGIPEDQRRNYKNVFDAFSRISKDEGVRKLWTGGVITMCRACSLNMSMLVSYEESKERLTKYLPKDYSKKKILIYSSLISSIFSSCGSLPFDNIKTKLQN